MSDLGVLVFIVLILVAVVLGGMIGIHFLTNPNAFFDQAFPKNPPGLSIFFSKKKEDGERLIIYYGTRGFFGCVAGIFLIYIFRFIYISFKG